VVLFSEEIVEPIVVLWELEYAAPIDSFLIGTALPETLKLLPL
jgi:hypothetical protein